METAPERTSPSRRLAGVAVIAFGSVAWWPAFTLGAWGTIFFTQILSLWAVATATFVLAILSVDVRQRARGWVLVLLLPTAWVFLAFFTGANLREEVAWASALITVLGAPALLWVLVRFSSPALVEDAEPRDRAVVVAAVAVVVVGAFALGTVQDRLFTCGDFTISGNSEPPGCTPGEPSVIFQR